MSLKVEGLVKDFPQGGFWSGQGGVVHALRGVSFELKAGETLAVVGESGCGKSTLAKCLVGLLPVTQGRIQIGETAVTGAGEKEWRPLRKKIQMVFQDPFSSLNPRLTISQILDEPFRLQQRHLSDAERDTRVDKLLETVGLTPSVANRFPHELSGGQRQRVGIARALAVEPEILVCDEPVSALDVSIQAQILNLFLKLQNDLRLTMIFITHDLRVASLVSHRVAVFYLGEIVEEGLTSEVFARPRHPYTKSLLASIPNGPLHDQRNLALEGEPPSPVNLPPGCSFYSRCFQREPRCLTANPNLEALGPSQRVACWPETHPEK